MKTWFIWFLSAILAVSFLVWIINIFSDDDPLDKGYIMSEKLIQEIRSIDRKAADMAEAVVMDPSLREQVESESEILEDRLMYLADELERIDPDAYRTVTDQVSESLLDLFFVQMENDTVSLRLGRVIEQQKLKALEDEKEVHKDKGKPESDLGMQVQKSPDQDVEP
jgi:hypothetical protein